MENGIRQIISCAVEDLSGDGVVENVCLTGVPVKDSLFWQDVRLQVKDGKSGRTVTANLPLGGYGPRMSLGNFTGKPGLQVLVTIDSGGSGAITFDWIYEYQNMALNLIFDFEKYNDSFPYRVTYENGFRVLAQSLQNGLQYWIDLIGRDEEYLDQVYSKDGTVIKPQEGFVNPLSGLYPVDVDGDGVLELIALQRIAGLYNADGLGYFQNVLSWGEDAFTLADQQVAIFGNEINA